MYQQHTDIAALATQGIQQASDSGLRNLSGKIRYEQTKQNQKLAMWYKDMGQGTIPVDYTRTNAVESSLSGYTGQQFDVAYAQAMVGLLSQNRDAAILATQRATIPGLRDQAGIVVNSTTKEIDALQSWLVANGGPSFAAGAGAGPCCPQAAPPVCPPNTPPVCPMTCPPPCPPPAAPTCAPTCAPACPPACVPVPPTCGT